MRARTIASYDSSVVRFRLASVPVRVTPSFWLIALLMAMSRPEVELAIEWVVVVFVSVLIHEMGHATAARVFGLAPRIELHGMGGTSYYRAPEASHASRKILVTLAGPGAGFVFGGLVYAWTRVAPPPEAGSLIETIQRDLLWANLGWGLVNLIPILPLDGGQVARQLLMAAFDERGARAARAISVLVSVGLVVGALAMGWRWAAFLCAW